MKRSHYFKPVPAGATHLDIYRVLEMWAVNDPCLQHAAKKILVAGGRGSKDQRKDVQEAIDTLQRRLAMWDEDAAPVGAVPYVGPDRRSPDRKPLCDCTVTCEHTPGKVCKSIQAPLAEKADKGGWIEWSGGKCPVVYGTPIVVRHRSGSEYAEGAGQYFSETWRHYGTASDIIAYRLTPNDR